MDFSSILQTELSIAELKDFLSMTQEYSAEQAGVNIRVTYRKTKSVSDSGNPSHAKTSLLMYKPTLQHVIRAISTLTYNMEHDILD